MKTDGFPIPINVQREIASLRESLTGMFNVLNILRDHNHLYVESRGGQMVHVYEAVASANDLLSKVNK